MARPRKVPQFFLAVISEEARKFAVKGPMTDDTQESNDIGKMAGEGYSIRCFTCGDGSVEEARLAVRSMKPDYEEVSYKEVIKTAKSLGPRKC